MKNITLLTSSKRHEAIASSVSQRGILLNMKTTPTAHVPDETKILKKINGNSLQDHMPLECLSDLTSVNHAIWSPMNYPDNRNSLCLRPVGFVSYSLTMKPGSPIQRNELFIPKLTWTKRLFASTYILEVDPDGLIQNDDKSTNTPGLDVAP